MAAESQVPLGTLQYVFPSKEKLLRAVIEDVVDEIAEVHPESGFSGCPGVLRADCSKWWR